MYVEAMLSKYDGKWLHEWEPQMLERSRDSVFKNTYKDIEAILEMGRKNGTRFEFECYDTSHLYNLHHFLQRVQRWQTPGHDVGFVAGACVRPCAFPSS